LIPNNIASNTKSNNQPLSLDENNNNMCHYPEHNVFNHQAINTNIVSIDNKGDNHVLVHDSNDNGATTTMNVGTNNMTKGSMVSTNGSIDTISLLTLK
jgi:hypothetical protein